MKRMEWQSTYWSNGFDWIAKDMCVGGVWSDDADISCNVIGFIRLQEDSIIEMDGYWAADGEAPAWRKALQIGKPIRT